ncbi:MAG: inorganic phosphate transporter [Cyanobacteria bacterium J06627_28]
MVLTMLIVLAALWLAYGNGANDNFKGVATLYGSDTTTFNKALWWATGTTFAGSVVSVLFAQKLVKTFSGKGLVPDALAGSPTFAVAVGLGAALTIFLATRIGMPTSTTHALIGGLLGTGIAASAQISTSALLNKFAIPMLTSPILAIVIAGVLYSIFRVARERSGITKTTCVCVGEGSRQPVLLQSVQVGSDGALLSSATGLELAVDETTQCVERYQGKVVGIEAQQSLDSLHYLSAGAVCFSRAVNDTPKVAALLLMTAAVTPTVGIGIVGIAIALGGIIQSKKVAETMSKRITDLSPGQGFTANITTAFLVLVASNMGVPVSTTHVSCGSIFGIGVATQSGKKDTILKILGTWVTTLPLAAVVSGLLYWIFSTTV